MNQVVHIFPELSKCASTLIVLEDNITGNIWNITEEFEYVRIEI